jgi:hypothetical protein
MNQLFLSITFMLSSCSLFAQAKRCTHAIFAEMNDGTYFVVDGLTKDTLAHYQWVQSQPYYREIIEAQAIGSQLKGFVDKFGKVVIPFVYEEVESSATSLITAKI